MMKRIFFLVLFCSGQYAFFMGIYEVAWLDGWYSGLNCAHAPGKAGEEEARRESYESEFETDGEEAKASEVVHAIFDLNSSDIGQREKADKSMPVGQ